MKVNEGGLVGGCVQGTLNWDLRALGPQPGTASNSLCDPGHIICFLGPQLPYL